ncbi:MAG: dephospho-CoA kinase [Lachnospiraceae bacterium]|nr:dephospho-CoA kinase [Lachnospiraceae bacterium]
MKVIGITGGIGAGKSLILAYVSQNYRAQVIDADQAVHRLQRPGSLCYDAIVSAFGTDILKEDGTIDRGHLGDIVFANEAQLAQLNRIVHPFVKKYIVETIETIRRNRGADYIFIEAALLIEEHYDEICDELWYIYVRPEIRKERLIKSRGYTEEKTKQIMASQLEEEEFRRACQVVIDNNGSAGHTYQQVREVLMCQNN